MRIHTDRVPRELPRQPPVDVNETLVDAGRVIRGDFARPLRSPEFERIALVGFGPSVALLRARQRFWFGYSLTHEALHLSTIVIDLGPVVVSALYAYERTTGRYLEHTAFAPARSGRVARSPYDDETYVHRAQHRVHYRHRLDAGVHELAIDVAATRRAPSLQATLTMHEDLRHVPPLVSSVPCTGRWFMYTHKAHAPASGTLRVGDRTYHVDPSRHLLSLDEHKAAYPYRQSWQWGSFAHRGRDGVIVAANLCANRHYTAPDTANENRLFVGARLHRLGAVTFAFGDRDLTTPVQVQDARGAVDLRFTPETRKVQRTGFGPYALDYVQAAGRYDGRIVDEDGVVHRIDGMLGVLERGEGRN